MFILKVWTKEEIKRLINNNQKALLRAVVCLYELQTPDEKKYRHTGEINGVGFNKFDGDFLTEIALRVKAGKSLNIRELNEVQHRMQKYVGQLTKISNENEEEKAKLKEWRIG